MKNLRQYGIDPDKKRDYESILYVMELLRNALGRRIYSYFAGHSTTAPKYNILMALAYINGGRGLSQARLGKHLITTPGNVTKLVDSLLKEGLVTRSQNRENRRENIVKTTQRGRDFIERLWPEYDSLASSLTNVIPKKKRGELIDILGEWLSKIEPMED